MSVPKGKGRVAGNGFLARIQEAKRKRPERDEESVNNEDLASTCNKDAH